MSSIDRISSYLHSQVSTFETAVVEGVLATFEAYPRFAPTQWGADERVRKPYTRDDVLRYARTLEPPVGGVINIYRDRAVKYGGYFDIRSAPFLSFDFDKSMTAARWPELLRLVDALATVVHPRFGTVHIFRPPKKAWESEQERLEDWMEYCAYVAPVDFRRNGPLGLGMRTYFGGDVLELFGRDLLLKTPAVVTELNWGGIRIDLAEDMWNASPADLVDRWSRAMRHLETAKIFAIPEFNERHPSISFSPSPAWQKHKRAEG